MPPTETTQGVPPRGQSAAPGTDASVRTRRELIRTQVTDEGFLRIDTLAATHEVSAMTIHRDLDELQRQGWLRKVRGGATAQPTAYFHGDVRHRMQVMRDAKQEIADTALRLVVPGQSLMFDESSTALAVAERLTERGSATVITNFLATVRLLAGVHGVDLISLGGTYFPAYDAFLGMLTCEMLRTMRADILFMSTTAITGGECYHQSQEIVAVKRAFMKSADRKVLLVDHTKLTKHSLLRLAPLTAFDLVVVDSGTETADLAALRGLGAPIHVAGDTPSGPVSMAELVEHAQRDAATALRSHP